MSGDIGVKELRCGNDRNAQRKVRKREEHETCRAQAAFGLKIWRLGCMFSLYNDTSLFSLFSLLFLLLYFHFHTSLTNLPFQSLLPFTKPSTLVSFFLSSASNFTPLQPWERLVSTLSLSLSRSVHQSPFISLFFSSYFSLFLFIFFIFFCLGGEEARREDSIC